ncbi:MAG: hypothetical protein GY942_20920 [Aestuariibacter sp.]|nr:hypothetical protein [Aestuariibacter sp.]
MFNPAFLEPIRKPVGEIAADIIPVSAQQRSIERSGGILERMQDPNTSTIGKVLSGADLTLEGAGLAADVVPGLKAAGVGLASLGSLIPMMARKGDIGSSIAAALKGQRGTIGQADNLPMDEASRMARAKEMGMDTDVYHGTIATDIDEFDPNLVDIGVHVGSKEQAENRLKDLYKQRRFMTDSRGGVKSFDEGANIMPLRMNQGKVLEMPDVGRWDDSDQVLASLEDMPEFRGRLDDAWEVLGVRDQFEDTADWVASPENREMLDEINAMLRGDGYDTVKYKNAVENKYGNLADYTEATKTKRASIRAKLDAIDQKGISRRTVLKENATEADVNRWLEENATDHLTTAERVERDRLIDQYSQFTETEDPYSYIVLDTAKLRSKHATYDPAKKNSANLLAGGAAASIGAGVLIDKDESK